MEDKDNRLKIDNTFDQHTCNPNIPDDPLLSRPAVPPAAFTPNLTDDSARSPPALLPQHTDSNPTSNNSSSTKAEQSPFLQSEFSSNCLSVRKSPRLPPVQHRISQSNNPDITSGYNTSEVMFPPTLPEPASISAATTEVPSEIPPHHELPTPQNSKVSFKLPEFKGDILSYNTGGDTTTLTSAALAEVESTAENVFSSTFSTSNVNGTMKSISVASHAGGSEGRIITDMSIIETLRLRVVIQHATGVQQLTCQELQPLKKGSRLLGGEVDGDDGLVKHIRSETLRRGCYFIPADTMDSLIKSAKESVTVYIDYDTPGVDVDPSLSSIQVRPFILFPSSMRVPLWLARDFNKMREWSVSCDWDMDLPTRTILMLTRKLDVAKRQYYSVWQGKEAYGRGSKFFLYGAEGTGDFTDYPYVTILQFFQDGSIAESQACTEDGEVTMTNTMASTFNNNSSSRISALQQQSAFDEGTLLHSVRTLNLDMLRSQVKAKHLRFALRKQNVVDEVEKVAYEANDPELMLDLYRATTAEMDISVLAFLLHSAAKQPVSRPRTIDNEPNIADQVEELLIKYIIKRRNPLSVTAAIIMALQTERKNYFDSRRMTTLMLSRFHSLHMALLKRLNRHADARNIRLIERILEPVEKPRTVNEVSPLQIAFESADLDFMSETLVSLYTLLKWQGLEFASISSSSNPRSVSPFSSLIGFVVLEKMGFTGSFLDPALRHVAQLWHTYFMTSYNFFNSPRGRWMQHAMCEGCFVAIYEIITMFPNIRYIREVEVLFLFIVIGNLADIFLYVYYRYGSLNNLKKFIRDPWNALGLWLNMSLLGLMCAAVARQEWDTTKFLTELDDLRNSTAPIGDANSPGDPIRMALSAMAIFVWARCLGLAVPLYTSLGPLLNTVAQMVEELLAFVFPLIVVLVAFATTMTAVFHEQMGLYENFWQSLLSLFSAMLGNFDFTTFTVDSSNLLDDAQDLTYGQTIYGIVILVVFLVVSAILLMNLLIAIITYRYRPEEVESESQFKQAMIMDYYRIQVEYHLTCSPFCLIQLSLGLLQYPNGQRPKPNPVACADFGLPPLDGATLPEDSGGRSTGLAELPHLFYLLTMYPIMMIVTNLAFVVYTPFACIQYVFKQNKHFSKWYQKQKQKRKTAKAEAMEKKEDALLLKRLNKSSTFNDTADYSSSPNCAANNNNNNNNNGGNGIDGFLDNANKDKEPDSASVPLITPPTTTMESNSAFSAYSKEPFEADAAVDSEDNKKNGSSLKVGFDLPIPEEEDANVASKQGVAPQTELISSALLDPKYSTDANPVLTGSSSLKTDPSALSGTSRAERFKKFKKTFELKQGEGDVDTLESILLFGLASFTWIIGLGIYLTIGFFVIFLWSSLYTWIMRIFWSFYNLTIYQFIFSFRSYRKDVEARRMREDLEERRQNLLRSDSDASSIDSLDDVVDAVGTFMRRLKSFFCCSDVQSSKKSRRDKQRRKSKGNSNGTSGGSSVFKKNAVSPESNIANYSEDSFASNKLTPMSNKDSNNNNGNMMASGANGKFNPGLQLDAGVVDLESGTVVVSVTTPITSGGESGGGGGANGGGLFSAGNKDDPIKAATTDNNQNNKNGNGKTNLPAKVEMDENEEILEELEEVTQEEQPLKTQARWLLGLELVTAMLRQRYMTETDVIKAIGRSKFVVNMQEWNIEPKANGKQDSIDDQLNDLEDNDDDGDGTEDNRIGMIMAEQKLMKESVTESLTVLKEQGERRDGEISLVRDEIHLIQTHLTSLIQSINNGTAKKAGSMGGASSHPHGILHHDNSSGSVGAPYSSSSYGANGAGGGAGGGMVGDVLAGTPFVDKEGGGGGVKREVLNDDSNSARR